MATKPIYMYLAEVKKTSSKFDTTHKVAIYPDNVDEAPKWFKDFAGQILTRLDNIDSRIDKLEKFATEQQQFNQFVLTQFKQHGWIK